MENIKSISKLFFSIRASNYIDTFFREVYKAGYKIYSNEISEFDYFDVIHKESNLLLENLAKYDEIKKIQSLKSGRLK